MNQLSVISVLAISMFVGQGYSVPVKEDQNSTVVSFINTKNETDNRVDNSMKVVDLPLKQANNSKAVEDVPWKINATENSAILVPPPPPLPPKAGNESYIAIEKKGGQGKEGQACNYKKETVDMLKCVVTPHDDDDEITGTTKRANTTVVLIEGVTRNTKPITGTDGLNNTVYSTVSPDSDKQTNTSITATAEKNPKEANNGTQVIVSSVAPLVVENVRSNDNVDTGSDTNSEEKGRKSMPSGIVALVTAMTFVLAVIFAYLSVIGWRRYVEYKYGHRELLVNDLEFDSNDLRHFEL